MKIKAQGAVVALGTFDGVHAGHRALISEAAGLAKALHASPLIYTFRNHPLSLFGREPRLLMTPEERIAALAATGIPVAADAFDARLAATPPRDFVRMLVERFALRGIVAGFNYTFGDRGAGDTALLKTGRSWGLPCAYSAPCPMKTNRFPAHAFGPAWSKGSWKRQMQCWAHAMRSPER